MTIKTCASVGLALILVAITTNGADARTHSVPTFDRHNPHAGFGYVRTVPVKRAAPVRSTGYKQIRHKRELRGKTRKAHVSRTRLASISPQIVAHPPGCPRTRFCGCGTSLYLLGKPVQRGGLAIANNWHNFPRVACAPRMAAARRGHVFAIIECLGGNKVLAYDPNSGGHKTRIHVRDVSRYAIVNPHGGSRYAAAQ